MFEGVYHRVHDACKEIDYLTKANGCKGGPFAISDVEYTQKKKGLRTNSQVWISVPHSKFPSDINNENLAKLREIMVS